MLKRTLLLHSAASRPHVKARIEVALERVNVRLDLTFAHDGEDDFGGSTYTVWTDDPEGSTETSWIRLTDEPSSNSLYLDLNADSDATMDALGEALTAQLAPLSHAQIDAAIAEDATRIAWLAYGGRTYDADAGAVLARALGSGDENVRASAQLALFLLKWRPLLPVVEQTLASATSDAQRSALQAILTAAKEWP